MRAREQRPDAVGDVEAVGCQAARQRAHHAGVGDGVDEPRVELARHEVRDGGRAVREDVVHERVVVRAAIRARRDGLAEDRLRAGVVAGGDEVAAHLGGVDHPARERARRLDDVRLGVVGGAGRAGLAHREQLQDLPSVVLVEVAGDVGVVVQEAQHRRRLADAHQEVPERPERARPDEREVVDGEGGVLVDAPAGREVVVPEEGHLLAQAAGHHLGVPRALPRVDPLHVRAVVGRLAGPARRVGERALLRVLDERADGVAGVEARQRRHHVGARGADGRAADEVRRLRHVPRAGVGRERRVGARVREVGDGLRAGAPEESSTVHSCQGRGEAGPPRGGRQPRDRPVSGARAAPGVQSETRSGLRVGSRGETVSRAAGIARPRRRAGGQTPRPWLAFASGPVPLV